MKAFATFSLILVAGILSITDAHSIAAPRPEIHEYNRIETLKIIMNRIANFGYDENGSRDMTSFNRSKCRMNGGSDAEYAVYESLQIYLNSTEALRNETAKKLKILADGELDAAIKTTCHFATAIRNLSKTFTLSLKQCLNQEERNNIDLINNVSSALVQYACENDGRRISKFYADDGEDCLTSSMNVDMNCVRKTFTRRTSIIKNRGYDYPVTPLWRVPIIDLNNESCHHLQEYQRCVTDGLRKCKHATPSNEWNNLLNIMKKSSVCGDFLGTEASSEISNDVI